MKLRVLAALLLCSTAAIACRQTTPQVARPQVGWSGWIEEAAAKRGYTKAGDVGQFGCPPGWRAAEDTFAAQRAKEVSAVYMGTEPPQGEGTITCVAQGEYALPEPYSISASEPKPLRRPLAPVWLKVDPDSITIGFRSELPLGAAIYIARDTPCGPRVIGVRLGDLLNWLVDPQTAPTRDFLGMISGGCPEESRK